MSEGRRNGFATATSLIIGMLLSLKPSLGKVSFRPHQLPPRQEGTFSFLYMENIKMENLIISPLLLQTKSIRTGKTPGVMMHGRNRIPSTNVVLETEKRIPGFVQKEQLLLLLH